MTDTGIVNIHGKQYHTVAKRVQDFREAHKDHSLTTEIAVREGDIVVMKAMIADPSGRVIATGHAEEDRTKGNINRTSALENAETSAIGRALAAFGLGGTEFASANEVENAVHQQAAPPAKLSQEQTDKLMAELQARKIAPAALLKAAKDNLGTDVGLVADLPASAFADALSWIQSHKEAA